VIICYVRIVPDGTERQNRLAKEVRDIWHNIENPKTGSPARSILLANSRQRSIDRNMGKLGAAEKEDPRFQELQSNSPAVSRSMKVALHRFSKDEHPLEHADRCASWRPRLHQECGRTENNSRFFCAVPLQNLNSIVEWDQSGAVFFSVKPIMGRQSVSAPLPRGAIEPNTDHSQE
jgi:hypothetical protein